MQTRSRAAASVTLGHALGSFLPPDDMLISVLVHLHDVEDLCRATAVSRHFQLLVEQALRLRATQNGYTPPQSLPDSEASWIQKLAWDERRRRFQALLPSQTCAVGQDQTMFVNAAGQLLVCGTEAPRRGNPLFLGALGLGAGTITGRQNYRNEPMPPFNEVAVPTVVAALSDVKVHSVSHWSGSTVVLSEDGAVYSFGMGAADWRTGALGHTEAEHAAMDSYTMDMLPNSTVYKYTPLPKPIAAFTGIRISMIAPGCHDFCMAACEAGVVFSWGSNDMGRLGHGDMDEDGCYVPRRIDALASHRVCAVFAGNSSSFAIDICGTLFAWGDDSCGLLGHGFDGYPDYVSTGDSESDGHDSVREEWLTTPRAVRTLKDVFCVAVATSSTHSLVLARDGGVYSAGERKLIGRSRADSDGGEEGDMSEEEPQDISWCCVFKRVVALQEFAICCISASNHHSLVVSRDGAVFAFGDGEAVHGTGELHDTAPEAPKLVATLTDDIVSVFAGNNASLAVSSTGRAYGWGCGAKPWNAPGAEDEFAFSHDQLGLGVTEVQLLPMELPGSLQVKTSRRSAV